MRDAASDKVLWDRAFRGDERGFIAVYNRYAQRLLTYAYRRTGSLQRAEDAVSLVMLETWRRRRHTLARIAQLAPTVADDLDRNLVDGERLQTALHVLAGLPSRDRDVLELAVWSGLNESEMADVLGIPIGTFKSRLSRARRRLAERCEKPRKPQPLVRLATNSEELQ